MRALSLASWLVAAALCLPVAARAENTQDLAVCANVTAITGRDESPKEQLAGCNRLIMGPGAKPDAGDYYHRAAVYQELKRYDEALADLDTALKLGPADEPFRAEYYIARAQDVLVDGLRTPDAALADATKAIDIITASGPNYSSHGDDSLARAYFWRACAYADKQDRAHAEADFHTALAFDIDQDQRDGMIAIMKALGYSPP